MDKKEFAIEMGYTAVATQSEVDSATMEVYFSEVGNWSIESFHVAMKACRKELKRFPTIKEISERRPRRPPAPLRLEVVSPKPIVDEVGSKIDELSNDELRRAFVSAGMGDQGAWAIAQFRRNPRHFVLREMLRDSITKPAQKMQLSESVSK